MTAEPRAIVPVGAELGEGPLWFDDALWFVDIKAPCIYRFAPATDRLQRWPAPSRVGWVLPTHDGGFVVGLVDGLYRFDPRDGGFTLLVSVETDRPGNRLNDAATDRAGRIWFGSMDDAEAARTGRIYCCDRGIVTAADVPPVVITNGPAVSPDGTTLYLVDTLGRSIAARRIDAAGRLGPPVPFVRFGAADGYPDGAICDAAGNVWVGFYGGWEARRYAPDGTLNAAIRFPVANVTKLALGGDDGRTVFATTARQGLSPQALRDQPLAGHVFTFRTDVPGLPVTLARVSP